MEWAGRKKGAGRELKILGMAPIFGPKQFSRQPAARAVVFHHQKFPLICLPPVASVPTSEIIFLFSGRPDMTCEDLNSQTTDFRVGSGGASGSSQQQQGGDDFRQDEGVLEEVLLGGAETHGEAEQGAREPRPGRIVRREALGEAQKIGELGLKQALNCVKLAYFKRT